MTVKPPKGAATIEQIAGSLGVSVPEAQRRVDRLVETGLLRRMEVPPRPRKGMGSFRDPLGGLWKFWRGRWRQAKEDR